MKKFFIHVTQIIEQDFEIEAENSKEARLKAEKGYDKGKYDPQLNEGEISHEIRVEENVEKVKNIPDKEISF